MSRKTTADLRGSRHSAPSEGWRMDRSRRPPSACWRVGPLAMGLAVGKSFGYLARAEEKPRLVRMAHGPPTLILLKVEQCPSLISRDVVVADVWYRIVADCGAIDPENFFQNLE